MDKDNFREEPEPQLTKADTSEKYIRVQTSRKTIIVNNFIGGITWAIGTAVGFLILSIIIAVIVQKAGIIPSLGGWVTNNLEKTQSKVVPQSEINFQK